MPNPEPICVLVLTRDDEAHLAECLEALLPQVGKDDEVVLVDAGSGDGTLAVAEDYARRRPDVVRIHAVPERISPGAARNVALGLARSDTVAFLGGDAVPDPGWLEAMRSALANADVVYGRRRHEPSAQNVATVARGFRYYRYESPQAGLPEDYASHGNAAYRRFAFQSLRFDEDEEDERAFGRRARYAGLRLAYAPGASVRSRSASDWRRELKDHVLEGRAHARLRGLLPTPSMHLAWAVAVAGLGLIAVVSGNPWVLAGTVAVFFAPTLRRAISPLARRYKPLHLVGGATVSPLLDLAFVGSYLGALGRRMLQRPRKGASL